MIMRPNMTQRPPKKLKAPNITRVVSELPYSIFFILYLDILTLASLLAVSYTPVTTNSSYTPPAISSTTQGVSSNSKQNYFYDPVKGWTRR